jgi:TPR repeat protein
MKRLASQVSLVLLLILAAVVSIRSLRDLPSDASAKSPAPPGSQAPQTSTWVPPSPPASSPQPLTVEPPRVDYAAPMRSAPDYLAFIRSIRPAAEAGNPQASLILYRAIEYCRTEYRSYFYTREGRRTLEEAYQWSATRWPLYPGRAREVHGRCQGFIQADPREFGIPDDWLRRASDARLPEAQAELALKLFSGGLSGPGSADSPLPARAMKLLGRALRSRKPEVVWRAAELITLREQFNGTQDQMFAWYLAACHRGLDCYAGGDLVRGLCTMDPACQPFESVADLLRRLAGNEFPAVERRADEINALIDAGRWAELGFGAVSD